MQTLACLLDTYNKYVHKTQYYYIIYTYKIEINLYLDLRSFLGDSSLSKQIVKTMENI